MATSRSSAKSIYRRGNRRGSTKRSSASRPMARLIISSPEGKRGILELTKPVITIGRGNANDLVLNNNRVSRFHAVVKINASGDILIADRGSTNGVLINGERIIGETLLRNEDHITIGDY